MAYDPARIAQARAAVRWNYTLGSLRPAPVAPPPLEPMDETTLAALTRSLGTAPGPVPTTSRPRRPPPPVSSGRPIAFALAAQLAGIGGAVRTTNTYRFPVILRTVSWSLRLTYNGANRFNLVWGNNPGLSGTDFVGIMGKLFDDQHEDGYLLEAASLDSSTTLTLNPNLIIPEAGMRFMVALQNAVAAPADFYFTGILEVLDPEFALSAFQPVILPAQVLTRTLYTAPLPAPKASTLPRGLHVTVLEAGRPMYSRDIAWASADVEMKKLFLNAQLSGIYPPTIQPIW